jgi:hypothetical protein
MAQTRVVTCDICGKEIHKDLVMLVVQTGRLPKFVRGRSIDLCHTHGLAFEAWMEAERVKRGVQAAEPAEPVEAENPF